MASESSANAGWNAFRGNEPSASRAPRAESRNDEREEGRRGVVGRVRELERLCSLDSGVSVDMMVANRERCCCRQRSASSKSQCEGVANLKPHHDDSLPASEPELRLPARATGALPVAVTSSSRSPPVSNGSRAGGFCSILRLNRSNSTVQDTYCECMGFQIYLTPGCSRHTHTPVY